MRITPYPDWMQRSVKKNPYIKKKQYRNITRDDEEEEKKKGEKTNGRGVVSAKEGKEERLQPSEEGARCG